MSKRNKLMLVSLAMLFLGTNAIGAPQRKEPIVLSGIYSLVEKGKPTSTIVIGEEASKVEEYAAKELQKYLKKISGAELSIRKDNEEIKGNRILIGNNRIIKELKVETSSLHKEGFIIKRIKKDLVLAGGSPLGTLYSVYDFLEELGCRFFTPKEEIIPKLKDIKVRNIDIAEEPDFNLRGVGKGDWAIKNKMNRSHRGFEIAGEKFGKNRPSSHSFHRLLPYQKYYSTHPEYYALLKGERKKLKPGAMQYCTSNPEVAKEVAKNIIKIFDENPDLDSYLLCPGDGGHFCECSNCQALDDPLHEEDDGLLPFDTGKMSSRLMLFYNQVAKEVSKVYPDKIIDIGAYFTYTDPPRVIKPYKNIGVALAHYEYCHTHAIADPDCKYNKKFRKILEKWVSMSKRVWLFEYYWKVAWCGLPWPVIHTIRQDIPYFKRIGVDGLYTQCSDTWVLQGPLYYVAAKLLWDAEANVDVLLDDYFNKFYGKAGPPIKKLFNLLEERMVESGVCTSGCCGRSRVEVDSTRIFTAQVIKRCKDYLKEAERLIDNKEVKERVRRLNVNIDYTDNFLKACRLESLAREAKTSEEQREIFSKISFYWEEAIKLGKSSKDIIPVAYRKLEKLEERKVKKYKKFAYPGLPEERIYSELDKIISSLKKDEGLIYVEQQKFFDYHKDPLRLYLNNKKVSIPKEGYFQFKKGYIQKGDIIIPSSPYISISFRKDKGRSIYVDVQGEKGGACALYIILPRGLKVGKVKTEKWEAGVYQDYVKVDKIGDRYLFYLRPEWGTGQDICIAELK